MTHFLFAMNGIRKLVTQLLLAAHINPTFYVCVPRCLSSAELQQALLKRICRQLRVVLTNSFDLRSALNCEMLEMEWATNQLLQSCDRATTGLRNDFNFESLTIYQACA
jgi:hypothetical protein